MVVVDVMVFMVAASDVAAVAAEAAVAAVAAAFLSAAVVAVVSEAAAYRGASAAFADSRRALLGKALAGIMPVCQSCPVRPDIGAHACRRPRQVLLRTSAKRPPRRARQAQPRQCGGFGAAHLDAGEYVRRPHPGRACLHPLYRPLDSCSRAAGWLCFDPMRKSAPHFAVTHKT